MQPSSLPIRTHHHMHTPTIARLLCAAALCAAVVVSSGCNIVSVFGYMEESRRRSSTQEVKAEYDGLVDKTFAVVVMADRIIQSDQPEAVAKLTFDISERLRAESGAIGYIAAPAVLQFQFNNPRWVVMNYGELAKALNVQRLVVIDLNEYRLNEPGNKYLWAGVASGTISVIEADGPLPDEPIYRKQVKVRFPDKDGFGPADLPMAAVNTELARRFATRAAWALYTHQEPYYPDF